MDPREVLKIVLREMTAYGQAYRIDWSEFDGRSLRNELNAIEQWARDALDYADMPEYTKGTEFLAEVD